MSIEAHSSRQISADRGTSGWFLGRLSGQQVALDVVCRQVKASGSVAGSRTLRDMADILSERGVRAKSLRTRAV